MIKISVIVPVYNTEKYLMECLDSLVNQTMDSIEIIVVNDGSTDNCQSIIDEYSCKYSNVIGIQKKNSGVSSARNFGIEKAKGKYISFVDSDDYVLPNMLEEMYKKIENDKTDIVVTNLYRYFEGKKGVELKALHYYSDEMYKNYIIGIPWPCGKLFKRKLFENLKFRDTFYEDLDIIPKLIKYTKKISYLDAYFYMYRQVPNSRNKQQKFNIKMLDMFTVLNGIYDELYKEYPSEVEYIYIIHLLRSTTLRLIKVGNTKKYLYEINKVMKHKFPKYKKNMYYKKTSWKTKLICFLAIHKLYFLIKCIGQFING